MASDDLWILGIHMTKFGERSGRDLVDLASEAVSAAVASGTKLKTLSKGQEKRAVEMSVPVVIAGPWEESCQIDGVTVGLTHVIGLGSACGVHGLEQAA